MTSCPIERAARQMRLQKLFGLCVFVAAYSLTVFPLKLPLPFSLAVAVGVGFLAQSAFNQFLWRRFLTWRRDPAALVLNSQRAGPTPEDFKLTSIDALLESVRHKCKVPGLAASFVDDGQLRAIGSAGVRQAGSAERVALTDRFHLGSCTKSMTATLIGRLVESGILSWDLTLEESLPDLAGNIHALYRAVTLRQLLAHRGAVQLSGGPKRKAYLSCTAFPVRRASNAPAMHKRFLAQGPACKPGAVHRYSNVGYAVAACVAETLTGEDWEQLMRGQLFEPLGLVSAGFGSPGSANDLDEPRGHLPLTLEPIPPGPAADLPLAIAPAGSAHICMKDFARYAAFHLRGARGENGLLLKSETLAELHTDQFKQHYAMGWRVTSRPWAGGTVLLHSGTTGLWTAYIWLAPAKNVAFVVASNCGGWNGVGACDAAVVKMIRQFLQ
jgi:CubicO group peptidase (beta-lactamase class C family)